MRKNLQQVISTLKQQIYASETPIVNGNTTILRHKLNKVGSILSGSQSAYVINWTSTTNNAIISVNSMLQSLQRGNLYLGSHKVQTLPNIGKYLISHLRTSLTADELVDLGAYQFGFNDKNRLTHAFTPTTYASVNAGSCGYLLFPQPHLQITTSANKKLNFQLQIPLSLIFDLLKNDLPLALLGASDLFLELIFDTTLNNSIMTLSGGNPTAINIDISRTFIYAVYYSMNSDLLPKSISLPFTDILESTMPIPTGVSSMTQSVTLQNQNVKRVMMYLTTDGVQNAILGAYNSSYADAGDFPITLQLKYNDQQYFTEPITIGDSVGYAYTNDCGTYGFIIQQGQYSYNDRNFLRNASPPYPNSLNPTAPNYKTTAGGECNVVIINFGKVPYSHPLIMDPNNQTTRFDNYPFQVLLKTQFNNNLVSAQSTHLVHLELAKTLVVGMDQAIVIN